MFTARKKIAKEKGQEPDSFEESVAQVPLIRSSVHTQSQQHEKSCTEHKSVAELQQLSYSALHWLAQMRCHVYRNISDACHLSILVCAP